MTYSMSHDKPKGCMLLIFITDPHVSQVFIYFFYMHKSTTDYHQYAHDNKIFLAQKMVERP